MLVFVCSRVDMFVPAAVVERREKGWESAARRWSLATAQRDVLALCRTAPNAQRDVFVLEWYQMSN